MKITNEVKQYIEATIHDKAAVKRNVISTKLEAIKKNNEKYIQDKQTEYKIEVNKLCKEAEKQFTALMKKYDVAFGTRYGAIELPEVQVYNASFHDTSRFANEIAELKAQLVDLDEKIKKDITRVIAQLSLGGTFEDLEKMLAKVKYN